MSFIMFSRYLYIKSSLQRDIQEVYKRDSFVINSICLGEMLNIFNLACYFTTGVSHLLLNYKIHVFHKHGKSGAERSNLLLYQACIDPWNSNFSVPFYQVLPAPQFLLYAFDISNVVFNIILFRFLEKQRLTLKSHGKIILKIFVLSKFNASNQKIKQVWTEKRKGKGIL